MTIENYFERRIRPMEEDNKRIYDSHTGRHANNNANSNANNTINNVNNTINNANNNNNNHNSNNNNTNTRNSIIDEDQLNRTFQEIVNCINLDDDSEEEKFDQTKSKNRNISGTFSEAGSNFSRSNLNFHHVHHSLLPEFNSIFGGSRPSFNVAVGGSNNEPTSSSSGTSTAASLGKSFLDDDWFPTATGRSSNPNPSTVPSSSSSEIKQSGLMSSRPITPASTIISSSPSSSSSRNSDFYNNSSSIPNDYICKLCNCEGHWMKDCRFYEPRNPTSSISSFKSTSSNSSGVSMTNTSSLPRTILPPGNYVCRLCNVAGHWIDQCSKFQPKQHQDIDNTTATTLPTGINSNMMPPMLGPGPTPNYRPPAYLSKPVPSNYICNLCNRPGHWIQQCSEFTPIINHKPGRY